MTWLYILVFVGGIGYLCFNLFFRDTSGKFKSDIQLEGKSKAKAISVPKIILISVLGLISVFLLIMFFIRL